MRVSPIARATVAVALVSSLAVAQDPAGNAGGRGRGNAAPSNPQANLPYGAPGMEPVSKWTPPASAGRQLTLNDLLTWRSIRNADLSNDGKWFAYVIAPNEGDAEVIIRGTAAGAQEMRFPIGDASGGGRGGGRGGAGGGGVTISGNNRWVAFMEYPGAATATNGRGGRGRAGAGGAGGGAAANAGPKLAIVDLGNGSKREFESVRSFRFAGDKSDWLAIQHAPAGAAPAANAGGGAAGGRGAGGGGGGGGGASVLELVDLAGGMSVPIANVSEFAFNDNADWVAYAISENDRVGNSIQLRQLATGVTRPIDVEKAQYRRLVWADSSNALAALRVETDSAGSDQSVALLAWSDATATNAKPVVVDAKTSGITGGLALSADRAPDWGDGRKVIYFGLREPAPPRAPSTFNGTTAQGVAPGAGNTGQVAAAPQTDAEVPSLILWHWKDPRTQATQQVQEAQDRAFSYLAEFNFASGKVIKLADDRVRTVATGPKDTWGIGNDITDYERDAGIKGFAYHDMYAVNLSTGERKLVQKKIPGGGGGGGRGGFGANNFSPDNSKYAYYDTGDWKVYDFASGQAKTITTGVPTKFWDTEDDHNQVKPAIGGAFVGWSADGSNVLIRDNWDVWKIPVAGGAAVNLTANGQKDQIRYQAREIFDPRDRGGIDLSKPLYFETYGEWTKKEGLSMVDPMKGGATAITWEDAKVDYRRARDASTWVFTRQTVQKYPDWYAADDGIRNERRLTDANPQQKDVAWSAGAVLINYTCDNGLGKHQAALFLPAGYEKGKKYPTLTYIYEKLSQGFHVYPSPNATRYSNPAVFTSRGYAFLQPDIVYKVNDPGRSAVWCVVPAVKAAIAAGYVDPDRVGLQGHSWGGYQTTFITTQTKIFKTAVAGAPLTDMTSMFGSIYWNSGNTDGSIFISSQGRFTGGPNEIPEVYARNSPQTFAQNLSIPFMLLSDDRDGAVDFNQGVTYYNHLRQLNKDVILLEYVGENHGLARPANQKDYALRMTEWFDTFLRDQPAPDWLTNGVPRLKMEEHLKERRVLVDPKATKPAAKITP
ncbi:MAG TPA: prolyl oligopeptidase family serine peptidase [Gemmatimonadaceae bacterium]|nr:prolyl oligopeptidase family serine peptidase [Gemmatimonadaceae bacterium]